MPTVKILRFASDSMGANDEGPESGRSIEGETVMTSEVKLTCIQNNTGNLRGTNFTLRSMIFTEFHTLSLGNIIY